MLKVVDDSTTRHVRLDCDEQGLLALQAAYRACKEQGHALAPLDLRPASDGGAVVRWTVAATLPGALADAFLADAARRADPSAAAPAPTGEEVLARVAVSDWRVEDGGGSDDDLAAEHRGQGEMTVIRGTYGVLVDARPPGADAPHAVAVEFDEGAVKFRVYRAGVDEVQATVRVTADGATVEQDQEASATPPMP